VHPTPLRSHSAPSRPGRGQNIGLISALSTYAGINEFVVHPHAVPEGRAERSTDEIVRLTALEEEQFVIAQQRGAGPANRSPRPRVGPQEWRVSHGGGRTRSTSWTCRRSSSSRSRRPMVRSSRTDDANRALMGSNMQRQAVRSCSRRPRSSARHGAHRLARLGRGHRGKRPACRVRLGRPHRGAGREPVEEDGSGCDCRSTSTT